MQEHNRVDISRFKTSSAGTHVDCLEDELEVVCKYSTTSWIFITFFGTTRMPYRIDFICKKTGEVFESARDKELIRHFMTYRRV